MGRVYVLQPGVTLPGEAAAYGLLVTDRELGAGRIIDLLVEPSGLVDRIVKACAKASDGVRDVERDGRRRFVKAADDDLPAFRFAVELRVNPLSLTLDELLDLSVNRLGVASAPPELVPCVEE
jgi:hypothetical protein